MRELLKRLLHWKKYWSTIKKLKNFDEQEKIKENYINTIEPYIDEDTIFCCDKSDIVKSASKELEALNRVLDGSTGKIEDGYDTFEIAALTSKHEMPVSVYSRIYSTLEKGFKSQNVETIKGLDYIKNIFVTKVYIPLIAGMTIIFSLNTLLEKMMNVNLLSESKNLEELSIEVKIWIY